MITLSIIIVLYNEFELVKMCLSSVYRENISNMEVILVDNSSDKLGHEKVLKKFPRVRYIQNKEDLGFGRGVNVGVHIAMGEFILILTPDMYLLPGTVEKTLYYIQTHLKVGMVGCRIYSSLGVQEQSVVSSYPNLLTQLYYYNMPFYKLTRWLTKNFNPMYVSLAKHKKAQTAMAISGQYMMIRKKAIFQINNFDPRFFLYFEDIDLCKRLNENGWKVVYLPIGGIVQNEMSGWKKRVRITQALPPYMKSLYIFFGKHYGKLYAIVAWMMGTFSVLISIPYLYLVSRLKRIFNLSSQATELLPLWINIFKWHLTEGLKLLKTENTLDIKGRVLRKIKKIPWLRPIFSYRYSNESSRLQHMLIHGGFKGYPEIEGIIEKDIMPTNQDLLLTKRLLKAYKKASEDGKKEKKGSRQDIWTFLEKRPHAEFFSLLDNKDVNPLTFYLCNMSRMGITDGITQGTMEFKKIISDRIYRRWLSLLNLDKLIALAEAVEALPLEDPEQGEFGLSFFSDVNEIVEKIEKRLKIPIVPPNIEGGLLKVPTNKGGIHDRDITAIYTSLRCKEILKEIKNPSICEIGAGVGKNAYYSHLFGLHSYVIIDLPHINILQGFYLIKSLPSAKIFLYGEKSDKENSISILPDWSLKKINGKHFDLTLNQDSFPEINRNTVVDYLKQIRLHTKYFFLSINQESQNAMTIGNLKQHIISKLVFEAGGFNKIYRFPYWLRKGYVEELYKILVNEA